MYLCDFVCVCCNKAAIQKETQQRCISPWHVPGCQGVTTVPSISHEHLRKPSFFVSADWASAVRRETEAADWRKEGWMEGGRGGGKILICPAAAARPKQTMLERQAEESHLSWSFGSGRVCLVDLDTTVHKYPSVWVGGMWLYDDDEAAVCSLPALFLCWLSVALSAFQISSAAVITRVESTIQLWTRIGC